MRLDEIASRRILLDTNVLNRALTSPNSSELHKQFLELVLNNELNICDTVYYEFLRNCSLKTYRERMRKFDNIKPAIKILRDNQEFFDTVWCLYLYALRKDPKKFLSIELQDIQIATCAIHEKMDTIITENYRDFPLEIFTKTNLPIGNDYQLYLMEFNREKAQILWQELIENEYKLTLEVNAFI